MKIIQIFRQKQIYWLVVILLLVISALFHGINMFHYPYYENDEGTYMSQAWSLLHLGKLTPYTYWYDHPPAGWLLLALWVKLTGGFFAFGTSVNSGRVFMLLLHLATTFLLFDAVRKLTKHVRAGIFAALFFSLSPLSIYLQRLVLLDNIMVFWVFLSLWLIVREKFTLRYLFASAFVFGIAVLTKENAIFFIPGFLYIIYLYAHPNHRRIALVTWLSISFSLISVYFLYALLKNELFPPGIFGDTKPHVSMIVTYIEQLERGSNLPFWNTRSDFYSAFTEWRQTDPGMLFGGIAATFLSTLLAIKIRLFRAPALFTTFFWLFLLRGKLIIIFYIIPLLPFFAFSLGMLFDFIFIKLSTNILSITALFFRRHLTLDPIIPLITIIVALFFERLFVIYQIPLYTHDETTPQIQTIAWIKNNVDPSAHIIIDDSIHVDLTEKHASLDKVFPNADWFWKVEKDPEVQREKLGNDWKNIDYIILSHDMLRGIKYDNFSFINQAFIRSQLITRFIQKGTEIKVQDFYSSNGNWMYVYRLEDKNKLMLQESWDYYKGHFIKSYGQVVDPQTGNTTSEGQSYAMLRAVWLNDKPAFTSLWAWTRDHLEYRGTDSLLSWLWQKKDGKFQVADPASAADADEDIALALLFAAKEWGNHGYYSQANAIIRDIWSKEVINVSSHYYLTSGTSSKQPNGYLVDPSYLSPASYSIFAEVDPDHPWLDLKQDSYYLLNQLSQSNSQTAATLPPNWILLDPNSGEISSAAEYKPTAGHEERNPDYYGYDAFRVLWRAALDAQWFDDPAARDYLAKLEPFFRDKLQGRKSYATVYDVSGNAGFYLNNLSTQTGALAVLDIGDKTAAAQVFKTVFMNNYQTVEGYWGDKTNYYDQNWAWFATAFHTNNLPDLWNL